MIGLCRDGRPTARLGTCAMLLAAGLGAGCASGTPNGAGPAASSASPPANAKAGYLLRARVVAPTAPTDRRGSPPALAPAPAPQPPTESPEQRRQRLEALWRQVGLQFVLVPGGDFEMATRAAMPERHTERVAAFFLGRHEVTVGQYRAFVDATGYRAGSKSDGMCRQLRKEGYWGAGGPATWRDPGFPQADDHPVVCVSWVDAQAFCAWAGVRLPTEAEWEYAAGYGAPRTEYSWGDGRPEGKRSGNLAAEEARFAFGWAGVGILAGYDDGFVYTAPVGSYAPNALGLFDMTGNVLEWTSTSWDFSLDATGKSPFNGVRYALRGGSWQSVADNAKVVSASSYFHRNKSDFIGFRVSRDTP